MKKKFIHPSASLRKLDAENILAGSTKTKGADTESLEDGGTLAKSSNWTYAVLHN